MNQSQQRWGLTVGLAVVLVVLSWLLLRVTQLPPPRESTRERAPAARQGTTMPRAVLTLERQPRPHPRLPPTNAIAQPSTVPSENAADLYRQAFALFEQLSKAETDVLADWRQEVDLSEAGELCEKIRPILRLLHQAAPLTNCDWGLGPLEVDTLLPHLSRSRQLVRTAVWSAAHCRSADASAAVEDLRSGLQLGHQVASGALVGHLVDTAIQDLTGSVVAENAGLFHGQAGQSLKQMFTDSRYEEGLYRAIEQEAGMVDRLADKIESQPVEETRKSFLQAMATESLESQRVLDGMDRAGLAAAVRQVAALEREYVKVLELPDAAYQAWVDRLRAVEQTNPLLHQIWPAMDAVMDRTRTTVVKRAMLAAGLARLQSGATGWQSYVDPATGEPFTYRDTADGFELQSAYQSRGEPVTLSFHY